MRIIASAPFAQSSCAVACMWLPFGRCWRIKPFVLEAVAVVYSALG